MHHSGGSHGDVEPSGDDIPSGRVSGRAPEHSRSRVDDDGGDRTFHGFMIGSLGFSFEEVFMGKRATLGEPCGPHTMWWRDRGRLVPPCGVEALWLSSFSPSDSVYVTGK